MQEEENKLVKTFTETDGKDSTGTIWFKVEIGNKIKSISIPNNHVEFVYISNETHQDTCWKEEIKFHQLFKLICISLVSGKSIDLKFSYMVPMEKWISYSKESENEIEKKLSDLIQDVYDDLINWMNGN